MSDEKLNPYEAPQEELSPAVEEDLISKGLVKDLKYFIFTFGFLFILTALILDGGWVHHYYLISALAQVILVLLLVYRIKVRRKPKTQFDVFVIRWGILPVFAVTLILQSIILR